MTNKTLSLVLLCLMTGRSLVPSDGALVGETRFEDWLSRSASQISPPNSQPTAFAAASKGATGVQG